MNGLHDILLEENSVLVHVTIEGFPATVISDGHQPIDLAQDRASNN